MTIDSTITPHGGTLVSRVLEGSERTEALSVAQAAPRITLSEVGLADLEMIATGGYSPLRGFMGRADYERVLAEMRLTDGTMWPIPITLPVTAAEAETLKEGAAVALASPNGSLVGLLELRERYTYDPHYEAIQVYQTDDAAHPGVARLYAQGPVLLAGDIWLLERPETLFPDLALTPQQSRNAFVERGWRSVVAFQTRNPIHRAHEYLHKIALETIDGLFMHPLVGATKQDDVPAEARVRSYRVLVKNYYPHERVVLAAFPSAMRYAGPREALLHAIARQNYGCTHFIVGRDHAGVGNYYGTYDAQRIFDTLQPGDLAITPLRFEHTFYCRICQSIVSSRTCPHGSENHLVLSGTKVREMLRSGTPPPAEFTRPEVAQVLIESLGGSA